LDLFEVFPSLHRQADASLRGRSLRLLSLAAIAYDDNAYYFEVSQSRYWVQAGSETPSIGVGGVKVRLTRSTAPLEVLLDHVRESWRTEPEFLPGNQVYLLEGERFVVLDGGDWMEPTVPHLLILTPPRLGGANTPDALAQAIYFFHLRRPPRPAHTPGIVRVERASLGTFLEEKRWPMVRLLAQSWADVCWADDVPPKASLRPVLALRGLRRVWEEGILPFALEA
jgi:hypothetical protein